MKEFKVGDRVFEKSPLTKRRGTVAIIEDSVFGKLIHVLWDKALDGTEGARTLGYTHRTADFLFGKLRKKESYPKEINDAVDRLLEEYGEPSETDELELDESKGPHRVWLNRYENCKGTPSEWTHSSYLSREDAKAGGIYNSKQVEFLEITDYVLECLVKGGFRYCK